MTVDLTFNLATNSNKIESLLPGVTSVSPGTFLLHKVGYPVGSWFAKRVVSAQLDSTGKAINVLCDDGNGGGVSCSTAPVVYLGRTIPNVEGALGPSVTLWNRLRLDGLFDFKTGYKKLDGNTQVPGRDTLIATLQAYEGYSLVLLGEGFCTMVVSTLDANRQTVYGGEIQRDSVFKLAVATFSDAITSATATGQASVLNMALVGRARAYVGLGMFAAAKTDAQLVPPAFAKFVTASAISPRRNNRVWQENSLTSTNTSLGVPYINMTDPRVPFSFRGDSSVTKVPLYEQLKYPSASSPIRLSSGDEARLIIAEADLAAHDFTGADSIISHFRARGGDSAITSVDSATVAAALYDQRRREFFLEGQHLGDALRFNAPLNPPSGTPYPGGGSYGTQLCMPLPDVEKQNNPNF